MKLWLLAFSMMAAAQDTVSFTLGSNGLTSLTLNGQQLNFLYGENLLTQLVFNGVPVQATCKRGTPTATSAMMTCTTAAGDSAALTASYSQPRADTLCAGLALTNSSMKSLTAIASTPGFQMPAPPVAAQSHLAPVGRGNPASWAVYGTGKWSIWVDTPGTNASVMMTCGWANVCKTQPVLSNIPAQSSASARVCARLSTNIASSPIDWIPEAYSEYRAAWPQVTSWPDRRPIMAAFLADSGHRSALNPRGYFNDPTLDVSNIPAFKAMAAQGISYMLNLIRVRPVQPQGIILWDIEGQEFDHATTYIGDPRVFDSGYAPEMQAAADSMFSAIRAAGYRVGVTLRPDYMGWGTTLPTSCHYDPLNDYKDYFIRVNQPYQQKFNACYDPAGVVWSLIANGNGAQTLYHPGQDAQVLALLQSKAQYAHTRWGATLFYVDSTVWHGGAPISADIFRSLQQSFPDSLFIPEEWNLDNLSAGIPYHDPANGAPFFSPVTNRWAYPTGAEAIKLADCAGTTCWSTNRASFLVGQKVGDIALYNQPLQESAAEMTNIESMIQQARQEASSVTVTDSVTGMVRTFAGTPNTIRAYPVKMRVYFAASFGQLGTSALYCESGQWLGENACTFSLAGMTVSQVRYYDFAGGFVTADEAAVLQ